MKKVNYLKLVITAMAVFFVFAHCNAQQGLLWAKNWNGNSDYEDQGYAITTDASGYVYVTGAAVENHSGYSYIETIKYSTSGNIIWQTASPSGGTSGQAVGCAIALDAYGNVWVTGTAYNGSTYGNNIVLIKYGPNGAIRTNYPKFYQVASGSQISRGTCLAVVDSTDVYVGGALYTNGTSTWTLWVDKDSYNSSGWAWTSPYTKSGTSTSNVHSATDLKANANNVWVTGYINNTSTEQDGWTAELNTSGVQQWGTAFNGAANLNDAVNAMYVDGSGNVYDVGYVTASTGYKKAGIIEYNNTGGVVWSKAVTSTYDAVFTDIAMGQKCTTGGTMIYAGGYEEVATSPSNYEYILAAFDNTAQDFSSLWTPYNPVTYDGSYSTPAPGTNQGYSVAFEPTTNRVYITGRSDEATTGINITTLGYDACNGSKVWSASYDYNADHILGTDEMFWKYGMVVKFGACGADNVYITGESQVQGHGFDYITLDYGYTGIPCNGPMQRVRQTSDETQTGLYPNPFSTNAVLKLSPETALSNAVLSVYDISGRLVSSVSNITSTDIIINRGNLKNGLYYYTLTDNGTIITKGKFIITD